MPLPSSIESEVKEGWGQTSIESLSSLNLDPKNTRLHNQRNVDAVKDSLSAHGQVEPLVCQLSRRMIIGGNCRAQAMREMGWTQAEVKWLDITDDEAEALSIRLNRSAELGRWDFQVLAEVLKERERRGRDVRRLGFGEHDLGPLLESNWRPPVLKNLPTDNRRQSIKFSADEMAIIQEAVNIVKLELAHPSLDLAAAIVIICRDRVRDTRKGEAQDV